LLEERDVDLFNVTRISSVWGIGLI
jgi:hypothetical protein